MLKKISKIILWVITSVVAGDTYRPIFIAEIFIHGSRKPIKNTLKISEFEDVGEETLMENGLRQHYMLGKQLRKRYKEIFSQISNPLVETTIYSSNSNSCILSSQAHLLGIFGDKTGEVVTSDDKNVIRPPFAGFDLRNPEDKHAVGRGYSPLQYRISNQTGDLIFMNDPNSACPFFELNITHDHMRKVREFQKTEITIMKILNSRMKSGGFEPMEIFGKKYFDFEEILQLWDSVTSYKAYFGKGYKDIKEDLYNNITTLATINGTIFFEDSYMKLFTTRITEAIIDAMNTFRSKQSPDPVRYMAFSGKDRTILPFLIALNLTSSECLKNAIFSGFDGFQCKFLPPYASNLIFELNRNTKNELYVRMLYNGEPVEICNPGIIFCKLDSFVYFSTEYLIESSFDSLCTGEVRDYVKTFAFFIINCLIITAIIALSRYISNNRSKVIKIGGVNRLVEVFSEHATMKNLDYEHKGGSLLAVNEILEEEKDSLVDPMFKSHGVFLKESRIGEESLDFSKRAIESDRNNREVFESGDFYKRKLTMDDKFQGN